MPECTQSSGPAAVRTAFDVARWFADRARAGGLRLQPMALQQLMFLAQAWYAAVHAGQALMPAVFVADELGPVEPNVHAAFSCDRPAFDLETPLPVAAAAVLEEVWATYGKLPGEQLLSLTAAFPAVRAATARGQRTPIPLADSAGCLAERVAAHERRQAEEGPRLLRTHDGRTVRVAAWQPAARPADPA